MARRKGRGGEPDKRRKEAGGVLSQETADYLLETPKRYLDVGVAVDLQVGKGVEIDFIAELDQKEKFRIIVEFSARKKQHAKFELLARHSISLFRAEFGGPPHLNPDGQIIPCPHFHHYREGFSDRYCTPIGPEFEGIHERLALCQRFLEYCMVVQFPKLTFVESLLP